ncbi:MAG TPA: SMP-30/gluconolactonase/LRE family protein [Armatimonadota bacterium]|nr:SMP-30/gluconolactonase/LRE family protein [Armatimonadota bacterium]
MNLELIADYACEIGENPLWHPTEKRLYWTDIATGRMFRYDPASGHHEQFYEGEMVGGFTIQRDDSLLLFMAKGAIKIWREGRLITMMDSIPEEQESRFNDVFVDPEGRVFCGTMSSKTHKGCLYRLDPDGALICVLQGIECSNGMALTRDHRCFYYTDSFARSIYLFDYEQSSGNISNQRLFATVPEDEGFPDGMTVDAEGGVWSARWDGACVVKYSPTGAIIDRISFPVKKVSSVIFGGEDYADLYVTTAGGNAKATEGAHAGSLYRVRPGVRGLPEFFSNIGR